MNSLFFLHSYPVCKEPANTRSVYAVEKYDRDGPPPVPLEAGANMSYSTTSGSSQSNILEPVTTTTAGSPVKTTLEDANTTDMTTTPSPSISTLPPSPDIDICPDVDFLSTDYGTGSITKVFYSIMINSSMVYDVRSGIPFIGSFDLNIDDIGGVLVLESKTISAKLKVSFFFFYYLSFM